MKPQNEAQSGKARQRYHQLENARTPYLNRARDAAELTIPSLVPRDDHTSHTEFQTPFQGLGARGVNNLASKLLLALLPPNSPFFRLVIDDYSLKDLTEQDGMRSEVERGLNRIERAVQAEIETMAFRVDAFEALKHLLVAGNALIYTPLKGNARVFHLPRYVVKRDPEGNLLEGITKEVVAPDVLPEAIRGDVKQSMTSNEKTVDLFTHFYRENDKFLWYQEAQGIRIPGTDGSAPVDKSPWMALRFTKVDGEDYGRGFVEEYLGDIASLEDLTKAIVEGSLQAARVVYLADPNGLTDEGDFAGAENGDTISGRVQDVAAFQLGKFADFRTTRELMNDITTRLSMAFMLNSAIQRPGERVTAEEIRYMAGELEDALGGVYSILSQEFQLPLVNRLMHRMERQKRLPVLPKGSVRPAVVTGMEALGRGHDLNRLSTFVRELSPFGPELLMQTMNMRDFITRVGTSLGIDMDGLVKSEEQMAQEQQQNALRSLIDKLGPNAVNQLGGMMQNQGMPGGEQPPQTQ
jgi:hypothetical protein